jgi:hypothetical protein
VRVCVCVWVSLVVSLRVSTCLCVFQSGCRYVSLCASGSISVGVCLCTCVHVRSQVVQSARITCFRGNPIPFPSSGGSNKSGKTERLTEARPTCIPDGRRVAAYVCVNLVCTISIILQSRNTADAHPLIIRSPI